MTPLFFLMQVTNETRYCSMCYIHHTSMQRTKYIQNLQGDHGQLPNKRNTSPSRVLLSLALCEKEKENEGTELALNNNMPVAVTAISTKLHKSRDQPEHEMAALKSPVGRQSPVPC